MLGAPEVLESTEAPSSKGNFNSNPYKALPVGNGAASKLVKPTSATKPHDSTPPPSSSPASKRTRMESSPPVNSPPAKRVSHRKTASLTRNDANLENSTLSNSPAQHATPGKSPHLNVFKANLGMAPPINSKTDTKNIIRSGFNAMFNTLGTPARSPSSDVKTPTTGDIFDPEYPSYQGEDFGHLNAGSAKHKEWTPLSVHTAKCDSCADHNKSVLQRCSRCNMQLCRNCMENKPSAMIGHEADLDSLVWDAQKVKKIPKPKPKSKPTTPKEDAPFKPSGTSQGRVAKRPDVGRAKVEGVRLSSREKPAPKPVTPALASDGKYNDRRIVDERFADYYNDHRREKEWDHEDEITYDYRSNEHFGRTYQEEHFRKYNAGERSGKLLVDREMSNNPAGRSPRCPFPVAAGMNSTTPISGLTSDELKLIQGESFDDILSSMIRLKKDKVQKEKQERQLQQDILNAQRNNPELRAMYEAGDEQGAQDVIEGAAILMRMRLGLLR